MQVQIVIYDPSYTNVLTDGPIWVTEARVERRLDMLGRCSVNIPATQKRALNYIDSRRVIEIWVYPDAREYEVDGKRARKLGAFVIDEYTTSEDSGSLVFSISGTGTMLKLKDTITFPNLVYDNQTVATILSSLATKAGWTASNDASLSSLSTSARFQGDSILKAYQKICEQQGVHFRESSSSSTTVEAGPFGDDNNLSIERVEGDTDEGIYHADSPMFVERCEILEQSADICNYVVPFGAGDGDAALSLADSNRAGISSTTKNSRTVYYITDATSVSTYGTIQKRMQFKNITQVGDSDTQRQRAANALFDAAYEWLQRYKNPYVSYRVTVRNVNANVEVGDKINFRYSGWLVRPTGGGNYERYQWADIDGLFWIMSATETVNQSGVSLNLELASTDRHAKDAASMIVDTMDKLETERQHVSANTGDFLYQQMRIVSDSTDGTFNVEVFAGTQKIVYAALILERFPLVAHSHQIGLILDESTAGPVALAPKILNTATGTSNPKVGILTNGSTGDILITGQSSDAWGGALSVLPQDIDVTVNSQTPKTGYFPLQTGSDSVTIDITSDMQAKSGGPVGTHTILVENQQADTFGYIQATVYVEYERSAIWGNI